MILWDTTKKFLVQFQFDTWATPTNRKSDIAFRKGINYYYYYTYYYICNIHICINIYTYACVYIVRTYCIYIYIQLYTYFLYLYLFVDFIITPNSSLCGILCTSVKTSGVRLLFGAGSCCPLSGFGMLLGASFFFFFQLSRTRGRGVQPGKPGHGFWTKAPEFFGGMLLVDPP